MYHKVKFIFHVCAALSYAMCLSLCAGVARLPLPPGFHYPKTVHIYDPNPLVEKKTCPACSTDTEGDELKIVSKDFVRWRKNVDSYAGREASWELLTIEHGYQQLWTGPDFSARLHFSQKSGLLRFVMRQEIIRFMHEETAEGEHIFRCLNADGATWQIYRKETYVVVENESRIWAFESPDIGQTWRLAYTFSKLRPELVCQLIYGSDGYVEHLRYPDGQLADFKVDDSGVIREIRLPNGSIYKLIRDPSLHLTAVEEYVESVSYETPKLAGFTIRSTADGVSQDVAYTKKRKRVEEKLIRSWLFENDSQGRIRKFTNSCGRSFSTEFAYGKEERQETYLAKVTNETTGLTTWMRHEAKGKIWVLERGVYHQSEASHDLQPSSRATLEKIGITFQPTKFENLVNKRTTLIHHDKWGNETGRRQLSASGEVIAEWSTSSWAKQFGQSAEGLVQERMLSGCDAVRYGYEAGRLVKASTPATTLSFSFDQLGRMTSLSNESGIAESWSYDGFGRVTRFLRVRQGEVVTRQDYEFDLKGQLVRTTRDDMLTSRYKHGCAGPSDILHDSGLRFRLSYDDAGRVVKLRKSDDGGTFTQRFQYDEMGKLTAVLERDTGGDKRLIEFEYIQGTRHIKATKGAVDEEKLSEVVNESMATHGNREAVKRNRYGAQVTPVTEISKK